MSALPSSPRRLPLLAMFRLGLFQAGLGAMSVLVLGLLNRVMQAELSIPLDVAAGVIAMHQFVAPARVWFGQLSDGRPLAGHHRTGYVWAGAITFTTLSFVAVQGIWQLAEAVDEAGGWAWTPAIQGWTMVLALIFAGYGLALSASSTPFTALLVDISDEDNRSQLVGIVWSMLMVGIIAGAITTSVLLRNLDAAASLGTLKASLNRLFLQVPLAVVGLTLLATWGIERRYSRYGQRTLTAGREDQITLGRALRILTISPQTGLFFCFLLAMTLGLFMQEAVLENYGADVFAMPIAQTTLLNAFFGSGTLIGLSVAGFLMVPRLGKSRATRLGCLLVATCLMLLIAAGLTPNPHPRALQGLVGLFGFTSGLTTTGAISLMLDLTLAETAGTFIGAWGLAQALARAVATGLGGILYQQVGSRLFTQTALAYGTVFALEAAMMGLAVFLLSQVNVRAFQTDTQAALTTFLASDLD